MDVVGYVLVVEDEVPAPHQVLDVGQVAGDEVVHADDLVAFGQESLAQVRADEAGATGDQHTSFRRHGQEGLQTAAADPDSTAGASSPRCCFNSIVRSRISASQFLSIGRAAIRVVPP